MIKRLLILCLLFGLALATRSEGLSGKVTITGIVTDNNKKPLSFATINVIEPDINTTTDVAGRFRLNLNEGEIYTFDVSCINYIEKRTRIEVRANKYVEITLERQSYALEEVVVMAKPKHTRGSSDIIGQQALEHIQPTSVADVLQLIPGGLFRETNATAFNRISLRQSGTDNNTSLGMAMVMDGIPLDNDGYRASIPDMENNDEYRRRLGWNKGIDLKTISTDHIQRIEIAKGISSAKLGNLSSGVMFTTSKIGQTPLQVRLKVDPLTKLVYAGKGFCLSPQWGYMHIGADFTSNYDDRRDQLNKYNRLTAQLTYNHSFSFGERSLFLFVKLSEIYALNKAREDELTREFKETFENNYSRTGLSFKAVLSHLGYWVDNIEWVSAADYTTDKIDRNRLVQLDVPLPSPLSSEEGESESIFLPTNYYSAFQIDNKPLSLFNRLNAESFAQTGKFNHKLSYGAEWKVTKNYGQGVVINMSRPPYPGNSKYVRPTRNKDIPALSTGAVYLEEQLKYTGKLFDFELDLGGRATRMFNLSPAYTELKRVFFEPRINAALSYNIALNNGKYIRNMFRVGYGQENKLPTLDYIYPDPVYKDFVVLSAYTTENSPYNHIITDTRRYDVVNYSLKPNRNNKFELGFDMEYNDLLLSLTYFNEHSEQGFSSITTYHPATYLRYFKPLHGSITVRKPEKTDYEEEVYRTFVDMPVMRNGARTEKRGVEYRLRFPKIQPLFTTIEINGAYYVTRYSTSLATQYHPTFRDDDKPMPYVGIYDRGDIQRQRILNTNVWLNTNIPKYKVVFTTFFQLIWLNDSKRMNGSEYPSAYFGGDGRLQSVTNDILDKIKTGDVTWRHYHLYKENYYEKDPIALTVNFKATKEFNKMIRASFFVNDIIDIHPNYKNRYGQSVRNWQKSFFGAEMTFNF